ncbi:hypothetical protein SCUCBS95973_005434 [Sporothrix curviconia]|uniref:Cyclase n=1 Tax=Sporothrix curviconia TaxID=1260050 RepID=A0ABP0BWZ4_9PEZI
MPIAYKHPKNKGQLLPTLDEIVATEKPHGIPKEAAWIWGPDDEIGRLNLLTPEHIRSVLAAEGKHGLVSSLNWDITMPKQPGFGRLAFDRQMVTHPELLVNDDVIRMNTQSGSQLDGFRHFAHQSSGLFYNNLGQDVIAGGPGPGSGSSHCCGIQAASQHGIVGRGVLLDYARWAAEVGAQTYDAFAYRPIRLEEMLEVAAWENITFKKGDILLVRTGWMQQYNACLAANDEDKLAIAAGEHPLSIGLDAGDEKLRAWLHDQYFSVVGGDQPAFEAWPPRSTPTLHEYLLACWGVLVGEMLDLEDLSAQCNKTGTYSFVFTSAPLNIPGGVASLANALCVL